MDDEVYRGASQDAIAHHYDVGNDFFALWLDRSRTYSCAWYDDDQPTLEEAQDRKHDRLIEQAHAAGARRVLDVGCGWGALLRRLVDHHGVGAATGLTLSVEQARSIAEHADDRIDVRVENWADHSPSEPYDAIISIGAFEHFAGYNMPRSGKKALRESRQKDTRAAPINGVYSCHLCLKNSPRRDLDPVS